MKKYNETIENSVLERFLRYVKIWTTSDRVLAQKQTPSTERQFDLLNLLEKEMREIGIDDIYFDKKGYLIGRIPPNCDGEAIGFMAHVDTSSDAPGKDVKPQIHENYNGESIKLNDELILSVEENEDLLLYKGKKVITTDGTTLLGADDKAGVAEIMTAASIILSNKEIKHGPIELIFTPDEETGGGMDNFPLKELQAKACYTMDGGREGELEDECYYAYGAVVTFDGIVIHPGSARGRLVNAVTMASHYVSMLPRNESPEATDGRFGNFWAQNISGSLEKAEVNIMVRSFDADDMTRRLEALESFAKAIEASFPGGKVEVKTKKQYVNMKEKLDQSPQVMANVEKAFALAEVEPHRVVIRGGTDGSRLTEMGVPTPNIFTGGHNFHSRKEWVGVPAMVKATRVILNLVETWTS